MLQIPAEVDAVMEEETIPAFVYQDHPCTQKHQSRALGTVRYARDIRDCRHVGLEMRVGSGKTFVAIVLIHDWAENGLPSVFVTPHDVIPSVLEEGQKWFPEFRFHQFKMLQESDRLDGYDIVLVSHVDLNIVARAQRPWFLQRTWSHVILDECHLLTSKNHFRPLFAPASSFQYEFLLNMSGTFYPHMRSKRRYLLMFGENSPLFQIHFEPLRVNKDYQYEKIILDLSDTQRQRYRDIIVNEDKQLADEEHQKMQELETCEEMSARFLRQCQIETEFANRRKKLDYKIAQRLKEYLSCLKVRWVQNFLQKHRHRKIAIFSQFEQSLQKLRFHIPFFCYNYTRIVSRDDRRKNLRKFTSASHPGVLLCNSALSQVGLNLGVVDFLIFMETTRDRYQFNQCIGRLFRLDQRPYSLDQPTIYELMFDDTIESRTKDVNEHVLSSYL